MNSRQIQSLAFAASAVLLASCDDPTRPEQTPATVPTAPSLSAAAAPSAAMSRVGRTLGDATNPFLPAIRDLKARALLSGALEALTAHLESGETELALADLTKARGLLEKLSDGAAAELAPLALALDHAEAALKGEAPEETPAAPDAP